MLASHFLVSISIYAPFLIKLYVMRLPWPQKCSKLELPKAIMMKLSFLTETYDLRF